MAIVVLSGHDLFEYARELLSYQVAGYILKSEKQAVLMELMRSIKERLDARERVEQDIVSRAQQICKRALRDGEFAKCRCVCTRKRPIPEPHL